MFKSPCDPSLMPGTWNLWQTGKNLLLFACPKCGDVFVILWDINRAGISTEKIRCPIKNCPFEDEVQFVGWDPHIKMA